jgi:hypothetical protein
MMSDLDLAGRIFQAGRISDGNRARCGLCGSLNRWHLVLFGVAQAFGL